MIRSNLIIIKPIRREHYFLAHTPILNRVKVQLSTVRSHISNRKRFKYLSCVLLHVKDSLSSFYQIPLFDWPYFLIETIATMSTMELSANNCQTPNLTSTQDWVWHENDFAHPTTTETQCQQYLSCYWLDFDETLKVGSWEHLEQIPTVIVTSVQASVNEYQINFYWPQLTHHEQ